MKSLENKVSEIENEQYNIRSEFEEVAHMFDKDSANLNKIGKRLEKIEYAEIKNCLRIFGLTDEENEAADKTKQKFVSDVYNVAVPISPLQDSQVLDIKRVGLFNKNSNRMVLVKFKQYDLKGEIFKARDRLRDSGIRVSNELTMSQRNKIRDLSQRGIQAYYKNGVVYQRQTSTENRTFARAHRRLDQDKAMDAANASTLSVDSAEQHVD
ncbi:hypothetical protein DPMN_099533 [Dreissena polymorpha]|uniref:Uncharacterized protein n=1 Tax=Dreissena polymorpha TaxID=45954 RepID=A0A9D4LFS9_DREPO|nr:hypothetical protein DPMN_099533 [Dreissena polymorpha]